jgi:hypothetical protein
MTNPIFCCKECGQKLPESREPPVYASASVRHSVTVVFGEGNPNAVIGRL